VLGDDREHVGEQLALQRRQVGREVDRRRVGVLGAVDRPVPGNGDRGILRRAAGDRRMAVVGQRVFRL
jgi:hypothetical protein